MNLFLMKVILSVNSQPNWMIHEKLYLQTYDEPFKINCYIQYQ